MKIANSPAAPYSTLFIYLIFFFCRNIVRVDIGKMYETMDKHGMQLYT